jgi:predicted helicase
MKKFGEDYNAEVDRYKRAGRPNDVDNFVRLNLLKWDGTLKGHLKNTHYSEFDDQYIRTALYRPFTKEHLYFDRLFLNSIYLQHHIFPTPATEQENRVIVMSDIGYRATTFSALITNAIPDLHLCAAVDAHQCFPFYVYDEDGSNRRENITDWALAQFQARYDSPQATLTPGTSPSGRGETGAVRVISKWDIFYYVYGLLHHPDYRTKFADNLKRELPRIPLVGPGVRVFWAFSDAGKALADLHLNYERVKPYELEWVTQPGKPISYRVEKMKLNKDKTALQVNDTLILRGIPPETFEYRLGNRSALDWVVDQYQISTDKRSGIVSDPNGYSDDERYIVNLVERVVRVSVETVQGVRGLAALPLV